MCKKDEASRLNNLMTRDEDSHMWEAHYDIACLDNLATIAHEDGYTSSFTCNNINLAAWLPLSYFDISDNENDFTISSGNDITGATIENKEYAIIGLDARTALVDITSPIATIYIAYIATNNPTARCHDEACEVTNLAWRDTKTYSDTSATYALDCQRRTRTWPASCTSKPNDRRHWKHDRSTNWQRDNTSIHQL